MTEGRFRACGEEPDLVERLDRIAQLATVLREQRGETEWTDDERLEVADALSTLEVLADVTR